MLFDWLASSRCSILIGDLGSALIATCATDVLADSVFWLAKNFSLLLTKISLSIDSESSAARSFVTVPPAVEKTRSDGTDVAGEQRTRRASIANFGKFAELTFHQSNGLILVLTGLSFAYISSSSLVVDGKTTSQS